MSTVATPSGASTVPPELVPILPFSEIRPDDAPYAGTTGVEFGALTRTGLRVPSGLVIGRPALRLRDARPEMPTWAFDPDGWIWVLQSHKIPGESG
jgi:hypothetical protein